MNNTQIFENTYALQQLPATMKLSNLEWRFLICSNGKTPVHQIQQRLALGDKEVAEMLSRLSAGGLLTEKTVTLEEFAQATVDSPAAPSTQPQTFSEYLQSVETMEKPSEKKAPAFRPLPKPSAVTTATGRSMSLQSVIQFILNQHPDPTAGHLATYQVFMGINTQLLKRNGITSLRFQDDRLITDPELQAAIANNIQQIMRVKCPDDVFTAQPAKAALSS